MGDEARSSKERWAVPTLRLPSRERCRTVPPTGAARKDAGAGPKWWAAPTLQETAARKESPVYRDIGYWMGATVTGA